MRETTIAEDPAPLMTLAEASASLRCSARTLQRLLTEGAIKGIRLGKRWFIARRVVEAKLAEAGAL